MHRTYGILAASALIAAASLPAGAAIVTEEITYRHGDTQLVGVLAYDDATTAARPGVLVLPEWWGRNDYPVERARQLAELGYAALAVDMYGDAKVTTDPAEAGKWAAAVAGDPDVARPRAKAALDAFAAVPVVDSDRIAAIGYCFGGRIALEMARAGLPVRGVVSFHGSLDTARPAKPGQVKARVLVCHGAADPMVSAKDVAFLKEEMAAAGADARVIEYEGAVHSFTNPAADKIGMEGVGYHEDADRKSWDDMKEFLADALGEK